MYFKGGLLIIQRLLNTIDIFGTLKFLWLLMSYLQNLLFKLHDVARIFSNEMHGFQFIMLRNTT